jgi:hypothetical protein
MLQLTPKRFALSSLAAAVAFTLATSAAAALAQPRNVACGLKNTSLRSISISSKVSGDRVRVCADWLKVSLGKGSSSTKPAPKATAPAKGSKTPTSGKKTQTSLKRSVVATATQPTIFAVPNGQVAPNTSVLLTSDATRHSKVRRLLGFDTLIRFTPIAYRWTTGDSSSSIRSRVRHTYLSTGVFLVRLSVTYSIDLKVLPSGKWISTSLTIKKVAHPLPLRVGQLEHIQGVPVFVIRDCLQTPGAIGC